MSRWLLLAALLVPLSSHAGEPVSSMTPYNVLYDVLAPARAIRSYDRLLAIERVESKLPGVGATDIRITIRAKNGAIPVPVGTDGSVDFPTADALLAENPLVETNQPKGSLALTVNVALRVPEALQVPWADLVAALKQADDLFAKAPAGRPAQQIRGVEIHFAPGAPASVTVAGKSERLLKADALGRIVLIRDTVADGERPTLVFSQRPILLLPYVDK